MRNVFRTKQKPKIWWFIRKVSYLKKQHKVAIMNRKSRSFKKIIISKEYYYRKIITIDK